MKRLYVFAIAMCVAAVTLVLLAVHRRGTTVTVAVPSAPAEPRPAPAPPDDPECLEILRDYGENVEDPAKLCATIAAIKAKYEPAAVDARTVAACGGTEVMAAIRRLHTCALANGQCDVQSDERVIVDFHLLLRVSAQFPLHAEYFASGVTTLADRSRLDAFVTRALDRGTVDFIVFGGASPTARRPEVDHKVAGLRALAARNVINDVLTARHDTEPEIQQANVSKNLGENYCLDMEPSSRDACFARDANARRQVVFVAAYPKVCRGSAAAGAK